MEQQLPDALNTHNQEERDLIILLVDKVARAVIQDELRDDAANISRILDQALHSLDNNDKALRVHTSKQDSELLTDYQQGKDWQLVVDDGLQNGDCLIETKNAMLDFSVEHRIDEALSTMKKRLREPDE